MRGTLVASSVAPTPGAAGGWVVNLPEWGRHVPDALRTRVRISLDPELDVLVTELVASFRR